MAESDKERLARLAQEKEKDRSEAAARKKKAADEQQQQFLKMKETDRQKTEELLAYCKQTFAGFKLVPTGHELNVEEFAGDAAVMTNAQILGLTSEKEPPSRSESNNSISLYITHGAKETGHFQGHIPVLVAGCSNGTYTAQVAYEKRGSKDFGEFKSMLLDAVASMGSDFIEELFARVRYR